MNIDDAVKFTQSIIENYTKQPLNDFPMAVLRDSLEGDSYKTIAESYKFDDVYTKKVGSDLWRKLSAALGVKVSKSNLRSVIERYLPPEQQLISDAENLPRCNDEIIYIVGRDEAISDINTLISQRHKIILIQAAGGVGKSTLAKEYLNNQGFELVLQLEMAKDKENITAVESIVEEWLKQDFQEEPGREFGITLTRLRRQLQTRKVGILIDNLEPALDKQGRFIEKHSLYVELLRVLADSSVQSVTLITSRERLSDERVNGIYSYPLSVLDVAAWEEFFTSFKVKIDADTLSAMHKVYGGNAKAMDILLGVMRTDFDGDMAAYWQENSTLVETELKNLVDSQFNRLQTLDTEAYKLLCRLGCFRYQDVPRVSSDALLALLWDVPENKQRDVIKSLQNRYLVEFEKGEYWLHPIIREQGIERFKASGEWEKVNRKAAEYWNESVKTVETIEDARRAFEAYYHYLVVPDYEEAAGVIIRERDNKWEHSEYLGRSFYRLGLLQPIISAILLLIKSVENDYYSSYLYNILGDIYWHSGDINKSIKCHESSRIKASNYINFKTSISQEKNVLFKLKNLQIASFVNIGICKLELSELEDAINYFEITISMSETTGYDRCLIPALFGLSFAESCLNSKTSKNESFHLIAKLHSYTNTVNKKVTTWATIWLVYLGLTYKNLRNMEKSFEMYKQAIFYAERTHYTQVKAKALTGLAELYRIQGDFEKALSNHSESIELLDQIGAKCDLAEAYYQLGLTYQNTGETEKSYINFDEAIRLFNEMEAPKQVEKVETAKRGNID
ncbi:MULTISPECIES: tetratricopeptide repeat protein [unclassified Nodularia (in: cyanobacteria)]|uniref:tetratricopeptide repeat protein n=1 Tax=unclassified Nodularia (in: cyanobacteria) TaxID=2656917 RepID=UPI00187DF6D4|nr:MULTISPECIES: tetratricopeptide repeat protein [unclassified Nodularia (in: cyanobacteria)]MBE9198133.1 tetratricopeptide repeat protein [Nodularia sp. LEGE 06071]MCC2694192.1 tetratricopeptide repeat protein [Nodularia sp. LEGE 04288]